MAVHRAVEVHRYSGLPVWRIIRLDATLYVANFAGTWKGHESATYKPAATPRSSLYQGFRRLFDSMLKDAQRVI
ncbi:hypothetical protein OG455_30525 [Kitasatospora sp. NBC_01287]|uniref:hypothetical protein n=1 Tax=Kitasatospora sp. NBC_01287 TaxID=2903573 RepID=UPI0022576BB5|nr:hypothetical protein [Kitasatospora sp. NBC_01287]MCX4749800.1 hypothetical protein [Kitasatospora sp. NBC_01287]